MEKKYILIDGKLCPLDINSMSVFDKDNAGLVPAPKSDEELYLKSDGTWVALSGSGPIPVEMVGATETENGKAGYVPTPIKTDASKFLKGDGTWSTPNVMTGAGRDYDGTDGLVPAPKKEEVLKFLQGDGTWGNAYINDVPLVGNVESSELGLYEKPEGGIPAEDLAEGVIPELIEGDNITLTPDEINPNKITISSGSAPQYVGATETEDATSGMVPAATSEERNKFLRGDGAWVNISTSGEPEELKIVTWADGSWDEIKAMLDAHYAGKIDIADYWHVGDVKENVPIDSTKGLPVSNVDNSISKTSDDTYPGFMNLTIIGFNHDDLTDGTEKGINGKAAVTIMARPYSLNSVIYGIMNTTVNNANYSAWKTSERRIWMKTFKDSIPVDLSKQIKLVRKRSTYLNSSNIKTIDYTIDSCFLLSYHEVVGDSGSYTITDYGTSRTNSISVANNDGERYEYFINEEAEGKTSYNYNVTRTGYWSATPKKSYYVKIVNKGGMGMEANSEMIIHYPCFCL